MPDQDDAFEQEFGEVVEEPNEEKGGEELILGKFKSQDDLVKAYQESEAAKTRAEQRAAEAERAATSDRESYDPNYQQQAGQMEDYRRQFADRVFGDDPLSPIDELVSSRVMQYASARDSADANLELIIAEKESDPKFKSIQRRFAAEMKRRGGMNLADPKVALALAEDVEKLCYGDLYIQQAKRAAENPRERRDALERLGLESPQPSDGGGGRSVPAGAKDVLAGLGLTGKDAQDTLKNYLERGDD